MAITLDDNGDLIFTVDLTTDCKEYWVEQFAAMKKEEFEATGNTLWTIADAWNEVADVWNVKQEGH